VNVEENRKLSLNSSEYGDDKVLIPNRTTARFDL
jgi:hypothetical protein